MNTSAETPTNGAAAPPPPAALPPADPAVDPPGVKARIDALQARAVAAEQKAAQVDALTAQLAKLTAERTAETAAWADERALLSAGVTDPAGIAAARAVFGTLPEDARAKGMGEWVASLRAEGAAVPRPLVAYFTAPQPPPAAPPKPPAPSGTGQAPPSGGLATAEAQAAARDAWVRAGRPATGPTVDAMRSLIAQAQAQATRRP